MKWIDVQIQVFTAVLSEIPNEREDVLYTLELADEWKATRHLKSFIQILCGKCKTSVLCAFMHNIFDTV